MTNPLQSAVDAMDGNTRQYNIDGACAACDNLQSDLTRWMAVLNSPECTEFEARKIQEIATAMSAVRV